MLCYTQGFKVTTSVFLLFLGPDNVVLRPQHRVDGGCVVVLRLILLYMPNYMPVTSFMTHLDYRSSAAVVPVDNVACMESSREASNGREKATEERPEDTPSLSYDRIFCK